MATGASTSETERLRLASERHDAEAEVQVVHDPADRLPGATLDHLAPARAPTPPIVVGTRRRWQRLAEERLDTREGERDAILPTRQRRQMIAQRIVLRHDTLNGSRRSPTPRPAPPARLAIPP